MRVSPIGAVLKADSAEIRIIHDLSFPHDGSSVNDCIPDEVAAVHYTTVRRAAEAISRFGRGTLMAKADIRKAYRQLPVSPADYPWLGFSWGGRLYFDLVLPMGCRSACATFQRVSDALATIARGIRPSSGVLLNILDDFFFLGSPLSFDCQSLYHSFLLVCSAIGLPLKTSKLVPPATSVVFLGLEFDTVAMQLRLPQSKIDKMLARISSFRTQPFVCRKQIESLAGLLNFAVVCLPPGRAFLSRLYGLLGGAISSSTTQVTISVLQDLHVWELFLRDFNGVSSLLPRVPVSDFDMAADASGSIGFGVICGRQWSYGYWVRSACAWSIVAKELYPLLLGLALWGPDMRHGRLTFVSDNAAVVQVLSRLRSRDELVGALLRRVVGLLLRYDIVIEAAHIPGHRNVLPDLLSRDRILDFLSRSQGLEPVPCCLPRALRPDLTVCPLGR
jgi:hypothetical protein